MGEKTMDAERALEIQRRYNARVKREEQEDLAKRNQSRMDLLGSLRSQMQRIELERKKEEEEKLAYAEKMKRMAEAEKFESREKQKILREKNKKYKDSIVEQMKEDAIRRYAAASDQMPESEMKLNNHLLRGDETFKII